MRRVAGRLNLGGDIVGLRVANRVVLVVEHLEHEGDVAEAGVRARVGWSWLVHCSRGDLLVR